MHTPSVPGLLETWERGQGRDLPSRGLLLLCAAVPERSPAELASLTIGHRNRLLLGLRVRLFGAELEGLAACPACGETLETRLPLRPLDGDGAGAPALLGDSPPDQMHEIVSEGWRVRFRMPTTADVMELPVGDVEGAARWLLARCVVAVERGDEALAASALPADVADRVARAMADLDPDGVIELVLGCPQCGETSAVPFDPAAFMWTELDQWAWRVLAEVRDLARAYGWSESDILSLSPWRRQAYLELLPA